MCQNRRVNVSQVQYRSNSFFPMGIDSWMMSQQVIFFVVLLLPLIGLQNLSHPVVMHVLRADLQEILSLLFKSITNLFDP